MERIDARCARVFLLSAPLLISAIVWEFDPRLRTYAGLSGVTLGVVTLLALTQTRAETVALRWIWKVLLALVVAKIVLEFTRPETSLFAGLPVGVRNVPLAHLGGAVCAVMVFVAMSRRGPR